MAANATFRRRSLGALFLGGAILLLVLGETVVKNRLSPVGFLLFWTTCLLCTSGAIVMALLDIRALRQKTRSQHRDLLESTFKDVEEKARKQREMN